MADVDITRIIITRADARARGLLRYFTGNPCIHGHICERTTKQKHCLMCHAIRRAIVRATRSDDVKAQKAASYIKNREKVLAKVKIYQTENSTKVKARRKSFRNENKESIAVKMKEWSLANRPLLRIHERRRRDRKRGAVGSHTLDDIKALEVRQKWRCANPACRILIRTGYHIDHIMPLALGGTDYASNLQILCPPCNQSKHARHPVDWAQMNGLLL